MKIRILTIGKIKEAYLKQGILEYLNRLKPYSQIELLEVNDESIIDNPHHSEIKKAIDIEGERLLKLIKPNEYVISLDLNKKEMTSEKFAEYISNKLETNGAKISFVIGGSYGLSDELRNRVNDSVSLSALTFPQQLARLILLEQLFRAFKIINNETYHK